MKIAVYLGSAMGKDEAFARVTRELGAWMGKNGHTLVYGGSDGGLMGQVCDACRENGGRVIGVLPKIDLISERMHKGLDETIWTRDMAERRSKMIELADAFIALPGGIGTLDEISEVICLISIREVKGRCVMLGANGYWQPFKEMCDHMYECGLLYEPIGNYVLFSENVEETAAYLTGNGQ